MLSTYALFAASVFAPGVPIFVNLDPPKSTSPFAPLAPGFTLITALSPFLIVNGSVPLPEIPFISVKVSAKLTVKPFVGSDTTWMFTPGVAVAAGVKFAAPFTANVSPNLRVAFVPVSALKVSAFSANSFNAVTSAFFANSVCNWPPLIASLEFSPIVPSAMLLNLVPVAPSAVVVVPSGFTKRACGVSTGVAVTPCGS